MQRSKDQKARHYKDAGPTDEPRVQPQPEHSYVEIPVTLVIELSAIALLRVHATQQDIPLEQLLVQYVGRCGKAVEQRSHEGILADCFDPMIRRNSPVVASTCCRTCGQSSSTY